MRNGLEHWRDRWHCVGNPMTGFRADTYPGELGVWVAIDTPTALGLARRLVLLGFGVLARDDSIGYCGNAGGQVRTLASLRKEITGGSGVVSLGRDQNRFWFEGGDAIVYFERDSDIASPKCWAEQEVVVTG